MEGEKAINQLLKLGIIERVDPNDPVHWSSPLHLPPKSDGSRESTNFYSKCATCWDSPLSQQLCLAGEKGEELSFECSNIWQKVHLGQENFHLWP